MELNHTQITFFPDNITNIEYLNNKSEYRFLLNDQLKKIVNFLKLSSLLKLDNLSDLFGIDYKNYLQVNYFLLSVEMLTRLLIKVRLIGNNIESINDLFLGANWLERETWDMFGIFFKGNFDLRRILTDYGFEGFPLLKLFPLSGYFEFVYTNEFKKVTSKKLELTQQYRVFELNTPWIQT